MKVFKILFIIVSGYFLLVTAVFLSLGLSKDLYEKPLEGEKKKAELTILNLWPEFWYKMEAFLEKEEESKLVVLNKEGEKIFETKQILNEFTPVEFDRKKGVKKATYYFYEEPRKLTEKEEKYWQEFRKLERGFWEETLEAVREGDEKTFASNIRIIAQGQAYPGQEKLGAVKPRKKTILKKITARPVKNLSSFLTVNKIILRSYGRYLEKDLGFKVFYLFLIVFIVWQIRRLKKEID